MQCMWSLFAVFINSIDGDKAFNSTTEILSNNINLPVVFIYFVFFFASVLFMLPSSTTYIYICSAYICTVHSALSSVSLCNS